MDPVKEYEVGIWMSRIKRGLKDESILRTLLRKYMPGYSKEGFLSSMQNESRVKEEAKRLQDKYSHEWDDTKK